MSLSSKKYEQKPLILLDIDGVVNAAGRKTRYWKDAKTIPSLEALYPDGSSKKFQIMYSPTVVKAINRWSEIAEIKWLTSWDERADTYFGPALGIKKLGVGRPSEDVFKLDAVVDWAKANPDRAIIWIDDQLSNFKCEHEMNPVYDEFIFKRKNTVLVSPVNGLIREHIEFVDRILADRRETKDKKIIKFNEGAHSEGCVIC